MLCARTLLTAFHDKWSALVRWAHTGNQRARAANCVYKNSKWSIEPCIEKSTYGPSCNFRAILLLTFNSFPATFLRCAVCYFCLRFVCGRNNKSSTNLLLRSLFVRSNCADYVNAIIKHRKHANVHRINEIIAEYLFSENFVSAKSTNRRFRYFEVMVFFFFLI